jgi:hypothetical protein
MMNSSNLNRRLTKLESGELGEPAYDGVVCLTVHEGEDEDEIINEKRKSGEIKANTLVIVRQIIKPPKYVE